MTVGIDEAGRGCWAGPLVVSAISLSTQIEGLMDSKKLTNTSRNRLHDVIYELADFIGVGVVSAGEVDELGLTKATSKAMTEAIKGIDDSVSRIIIDGNYNYLSHLNYPAIETIVQADAKVPAVSAASIIAKVTRDNYMKEISSLYSEYGFDRHVGYGTKAHKTALELHGPCSEHRKTYKPVRRVLQR